MQSQEVRDQAVTCTRLTFRGVGGGLLGFVVELARRVGGSDGTLRRRETGHNLRAHALKLSEATVVVCELLGINMNHVRQNLATHTHTHTHTHHHTIRERAEGIRRSGPLIKLVTRFVRWLKKRTCLRKS